MSTKTFFKRIALGLVAALGFGLLTGPSSNAAGNSTLITTSLALSSATATANVSDTATGSMTLKFTGATQYDSVTVRTSCEAPLGGTCPALLARQTDASDTSNVYVAAGRSGNWVNLSGWSESLSATTSTARSVISFKAVGSASAFQVAGTYTYTMYLTASSATDIVSGTTVTWSVTVSALDTTAASLSRKYLSTDQTTASWARARFLSSTESAITAVAGTATSPAVVGYAFVVVANAAGDTRVALGSSFSPVQDSLTVTVNGPGLVSSTAGATTGSKSATLSVGNGGTLYGTETLTILSDGTAGTMTITYSKGSATLGTQTVKFTGAASSISAYVNDTQTVVGKTITMTATVTDAAGNALNAGTFYVFASDTNIVSSKAVPTTTTSTVGPKQTVHACSDWTTTTGKLTCTFAVGTGTNGLETGTATVTIRDSWNVTAAAVTSNDISMVVTGKVAASVTVAFDKATYAPGERAVITITAKDIAGKAIATSSGDGEFSQVIDTPSLTRVTTTGLSGTQDGAGLTFNANDFYGLNDSGIETRVVTMPGYGTDVSYSIKFPTFGTTGAALTTVTASAKVVDPSQTAQNTAIANAQAAADAATDAALQAIDAANAATDAANLAAEAADAATVAAQESKDAADAATAAVESLATQVATLMAALQAQITSLANVVAKIAKKVKA